jgi:hypothetical protein
MYRPKAAAQLSDRIRKSRLLIELRSRSDLPARRDRIIIRALSGDRDIATTEIYTHLVVGAFEGAFERL